MTYNFINKDNKIAKLSKYDVTLSFSTYINMQVKV